VRELLEISHEMRRTRPVFIVGEARSGTSMLYRTLQKHPSFRPYEINLVETDIFRVLHRVFMFHRGYPPALLRFMLGNEQLYSSFLRTIRVPRIVSALSVGPNMALRSHPDWLWEANVGRLVVRSYFFHAAQARGCGRLVEKTPTNSAHLLRLSRTFPRARLLYIHRHPVDVLSSHLRRANIDPAAGWARIGVEQFCGAYERSANEVLQWVEGSRRNLRMIRYDDFTHDPEQEFRDVCRFLDEPFDRAAVEESNPNSMRWPVDAHLWGEIVPMTKRWQDYLSGTDAKRVQDRLQVTMKRLGYSRYS
jgi:hypothetical protein